MTFQNIERNVLLELKKFQPAYTTDVAKQYHGAGNLPKYESKLIFLGYNVPSTKRVSKILCEQNLSFAKLRDLFLHSKIYEVKLICLHCYATAWTSASRKKELFSFLEKHSQKIANSIDCWPLADLLSSLVNCALQESLTTMLPIVDSLKSSKNPWQERIGLVSLIYYSTPKKKPALFSFSEYLKRILQHAHSDHLYVQKGLGWQLRELGKAFPLQYENWFNSFAYKLDSVAFASASEKVNKLCKSSVLIKRSQLRAKQ
jgi:3-methyladenine DNA glycosylase AlkD